MGWASAGEIFDPVAEALIELGAPGVVKRRVLGPLMDKLTMDDWDTQLESLEKFKDDQMIVAMFGDRGFKLAHTCPTCGRDCDEKR